MDDVMFKYYCEPQIGGAMPYFQGMRRAQTGGGFFGGLMKSAIPLLKRAGKSIANVAMNTASDVLNNKSDVTSSLMKHGVNEVKQQLNVATKRKARARRPVKKAKVAKRNIFID